ncbi:hypothetical protein SGGMMB4_00354 [Sodalis glossinidius str. 'morsitans']|uniref:Uncharacterized protein n=1 Tax=Sodalis glossinidius (strain morsitans) TaxID=343509 RepID=A0A193QF51_SODGM|nr:hypothetical protein SGGMMB4_00354 [Sodalis glossinidius str. 'morsitans']
MMIDTDSTEAKNHHGSNTFLTSRVFILLCCAYDKGESMPCPILKAPYDADYRQCGSVIDPPLELKPSEMHGFHPSGCCDAACCWRLSCRILVQQADCAFHRSALPDGRVAFSELTLAHSSSNCLASSAVKLRLSLMALSRMMRIWMLRAVISRQSSSHF